MSAGVPLNETEQLEKKEDLQVRLDLTERTIRDLSCRVHNVI